MLGQEPSCWDGRKGYVPVLAERSPSFGAMLREIIQVQTNGAKAFPYRVELTDAGGPLLYGGGPQAYNDYNGFNSGGRPRSPLQQREARAHLQTYGGNEAIDWLMNAVHFTVTAASSTDWHFENKAGDILNPDKSPSDPSGTKLAPQDLVSLFREPNPFMDWADLIEITLIDWLLVGNAYWVKWPQGANTKPLALYRMCPEYVRIVPGQFGPEAYAYRLPGDREDTFFTPDQVIQFKRTNPHDPYYGLGIVQGGARALDMEIELTKTMASYYEKQALPSGVVQTDRRVPKDVFQRLKQQLRSFYTRSNNAGQLMVLEAGLKYQTVSPTAADALFAQMGAWSRDRVLAMFNLNKGLLGIQDTGTADPKLGDWQLLFDRKTMIPVTRRFGSAITRALVDPGWGLKFKFDYEETQQPDQILNRAGMLAKLPGVKVRELRKAAMLPESTGDKEIDEMVLNLPGPNMDANGQGGTADQNLPGEAGRPPKMENTLPIKAPAGPAPGTAAVTAKAGKKSLPEILGEIDARMDELESKALKPADHVHVGALSGDHVIPPEDTLHPKRISEIDVLSSDLEKELFAAATQLERGLLDAAEGKAVGTAYQRIKNSRAWKTFRDRLTTALEDAAQMAFSLANVHHSNSGLAPTDIDYKDAAAKLIDDKRVNGLLETFKKIISDKVTKAQRSGTTADVNAAVRDSIQQWTSNNATAIALDMSTLAYNEGTLAVAEANDVTHVLVSDGTDHDKPCIDANGKTWTIQQARDNPSEHPRCRRAFVPLVNVSS